MLALNSKGEREGVRPNRGLGSGRTSEARESIAEIHYGPYPAIPFFCHFSARGDSCTALMRSSKQTKPSEVFVVVPSNSTSHQ